MEYYLVIIYLRIIIYLAIKKITLKEYKSDNIVTNLSVPENLIWKENATATATWKAVENANYYKVYVYVYNNDILIGSTETGTGSNEIDLQHEINKISENEKYQTVQVKFKVIATYMI